MALDALKRFSTGLLPILALVLLLLVTLALMSDATENSVVFDRMYSGLLVINVLGLAALLILIGVNLFRLILQLRRRLPGARLTARMVAVFMLLASVPVLVVYLFSLQFLQRGIDSWFDVQIEHALDDALELSQASLGERMRELRRQTEVLATELIPVPDELAALRLNDLRQAVGATEMVLLASNGRILASSTSGSTAIVPNRPDEAISLQVRQLGSYADLAPIPDVGLKVRVVVSVASPSPPGEARLLQVLYPIAERINELAGSVQHAFAEYQKLAYLRDPLKWSFILTLSLVLLLSVLAAVWTAFYSARRMVAPIQDLAEGTRAVAEGDFGTQLVQSGNDELGFLVKSFNTMTRRLAQARDEANLSQEKVEEQRTYLEAVLTRLSSGVLTLDQEARLYTCNSAAEQILGISVQDYRGQPLSRIAHDHPHLEGLVNTVLPFCEENDADWRAEVDVFGAGGRQVLVFRGARLADVGHISPGHVLVFDDITTLIQAQKDAAWTEVARRLAHEIKNPLTPIRLSAERLSYKYKEKLPDSDRDGMDRLTRTIVQQVDSMKEMVNAFSNYARPPRMQTESLDLNALITDVLELYRFNDGHTRVEASLSDTTPLLTADPDRLRQVLHNLIKNGLEAGDPQGDRRVIIATRVSPDGIGGVAELQVRDNGSGFPDGVLRDAFEPYVSTKAKGSGLGLAIVKKIVEEHGGVVVAENLADSGAQVSLRFPLLSTEAPANEQDRME